MLQLRNLNAPTVQLEEPVGLELVQDTRHVETAVANLCCKLRHEYAYCLRSGRQNAALGYEADDALFKRLWATTPRLVQEFLRLCGQQIQHVDAENQERLAQTYQCEYSAAGSQRVPRVAG